MADRRPSAEWDDLKDAGVRDTPTPHSTQEESALVWLERELKEHCIREANGDWILVLPPSKRDRLLAAIKAWREEGLR